MTKDYFVNLANDKHNDVYDYTKTVYNGSKCDVLIICRIHGEFMKNANSHLRGSGCNMCVIEKSRKSKEDFIRSAKNKHNDRYNYDKSVYLTVRDKVIIECNIHGVFKQMPLSHIKGSGCPKCTNYISKPETEWLDSLNILEENRQYRIGRYKVDGFDPVTNNVYEFNGDYWHGNPNYYNLDDYNSVAKKTYGELYRKTLLKEKILSDKGYNVISIWGSDFKKIKTQL